MLTPRELARRAGRRPRVLAAMVAASALLCSLAVVGHSAGVEAETRGRLLAEIDDVAAAITRTADTGRAVVAAHLTAAVCVAEASDRLAPVASGGERLTSSSFERASTVVADAPDVAPVPAYDPAPPAAPPADGSVDELEQALAELRRTSADTEAEVAGLASTARRTEQQCRTAEAAVATLVAEITRRTDELIAANPKAAADSASALGATRAAVLAGETGAVANWLAAAAALESSHTAAVLAEQREAEAARQAAEAAESVRDRPSRGGVTFDATPAPGDPGPRELSSAELCQLVPSLCTNGAPTPLPLDD